MCTTYNEKKYYIRKWRYTVIKNIEVGQGCKYLGILEPGGLKNFEWSQGGAEKIIFRGIKKTLKSKLNSGNVVKLINSRAVAVTGYGAGPIKWVKDELRTIDRKTRKKKREFTEHSTLRMMLIGSREI